MLDALLPEATADMMKSQWSELDEAGQQSFADMLSDIVYGRLDEVLPKETATVMKQQYASLGRDQKASFCESLSEILRERDLDDVEVPEDTPIMEELVAELEAEEEDDPDEACEDEMNMFFDGPDDDSGSSDDDGDKPSANSAPSNALSKDPNLPLKYYERLIEKIEQGDLLLQDVGKSAESADVKTENELAQRQALTALREQLLLALAMEIALVRDALSNSERTAKNDAILPGGCRTPSRAHPLAHTLSHTPSRPPHSPHLPNTQPLTSFHPPLIFIFIFIFSASSPRLQQHGHCGREHNSARRAGDDGGGGESGGQGGGVGGDACRSAKTAAAAGA
jgi:hypothetical protein